ncbi:MULTISPECIES: D-alanyl-D-alanine carboxypeptidase [unclassified Streptomyces]|uniref:D-alanyl-D-alanine carboxypeptidase n=1 Tax=unclassified Streptomyces TaxID=2593676 RepID=UPI000DB98656|nr:D-alanyl-D-alanine carboxypeptidase [Streptomyces sp. PsTaAH-137]MYT72745.1 D-alanyl-D-alanine carboxypeptidase [Streptomyces sp. SID8367]RAJ79602.1 D-alanyl-D-alanine carboxypeptidase [Streptomyces sp. PsTaAH-137]
MAGTPDRSGEQQASGGPGSQERDPRLAVARETSPEVDRATAVFSVRDAAGKGSGSGSGSTGTETGAKPEAGAASGTGSGADEPGDARLRAAVAAWVTGGGTGDSAGGSAGAGSDGGEDAGPAASERADDAGDSGAEDSDAGDSGAEEPAAEAGDDEPADAEPEGARPADDGEGAEAADDEPAAVKGAGAEDSDAEDSGVEEPTAEPAAEPADDAEGAETKGLGAEGSGAEGSGAEAADAEPEDARPAEAAAASEDVAASEDDDAEGAGGEDADVDAEPAVSEAVAKAAALDAAAEAAEAKLVAPDPRSAAAKPAAPEPESGDAEDAEDAEAEAADKDAAPEPDAKKADPDPKPPAVDQPTAVFKAVQPSVDQPTTMLKSPAAGAGKAEAKGKAKEESEAERTSRFVPLKSLDEGAGAGAGAAKAETPAVAEPERTRQTPLPPKPPLDLLAELTNTPPPPETRTRTAVRRVKVWTPIVFLLIVAFAIVQAVRPLPTPTLQLTAQETVSFDGGKPSVPWPGQGQAAMDVNGIGTFGTSGDQKPVPIASIAKVMTVYLILRDHPLKPGEKGPKIPVDAAAQKHYETGKAENESVVKVTEGQKISEYEALQAVMLPSANNIAKLLARWDTGSSSEDKFVDKMNKTAKELGMKNTTYTDPSGLDKTTVSTAADLVKLGRAAMENPVFKDVSSQPSYVDLNGDKQNNFFGLVPTVAIGIKTGTTTAAGGNILFAAEKKVDGKTQTIIGAALGQYGHNGTANIDEVTGVVRKLIESGQSALTAKKIVTKGDVVGQVDDGLGGTTPVVATKDVTAVGWSGLTVKLKLDEQKGRTPPHSAKAGTEVGVLSVGDGKNDAVEVPVALQSDLAEPGFGAKIKRVG